jgi:hypothetical protein
VADKLERFQAAQTGWKNFETKANAARDRHYPTECSPAAAISGTRASTKW